MFNIFKREKEFGTGALFDQEDFRDQRYEPVAAAGELVDWGKGFDVEEELNIKVLMKNQNGSGSCVGQGWAYYVAIINAAEVGFYDEASAKAIYSQIQLGLPGGGAYIRDGGKLIVNWGALREANLTSYDNGKPPAESFMTEKIWKTPAMDKLAKVLQSKEYKTFSAANNMNMFAQAIRDNHGVVGGVRGSNNGTWNSFEPKAPTKDAEWGHCIYFGKFGTDEKGRYIATPNSWGTRGTDDSHPDGWQRLRQDWFESEFMFNPWTLVDKANIAQISDTVKAVINKYEKKFVTEGEGPGRKGIIVNGELRPVNVDREAAASIYVQTNNGDGVTVTSKMFDEMPKGANF